MHGDGDLICFGCRLDQDRNTAAFGELDGVAGKVEPHLPQPRRIAKHARWQPLVDIAADFKALGLSRGPKSSTVSSMKLARANGSTARSKRPASIFARSSNSSINDTSVARRFSSRANRPPVRPRAAC